MKVISASVFLSLLFSVLFLAHVSGNSLSPLPAKDAAAVPIFGYRDSTAENAVESRFLAVPDPKLAEEHLRVLTQAPHMAGTPRTRPPPTTSPGNFAMPASKPKLSNTASG